MTQHENHGIQLLEYQQWRMSFRAGQNNIIADNGNCEGFLELLEQNETFVKRFFVLDIGEMKFKYFLGKTKKHTVECIGSVDVRYITQVSKVTHKPKKSNSFEVNTPSKKYIFVAATEREMTYWVDALTLAAISPAKKSRSISYTEKSNSMENLSESTSLKTSIIGGVVVKTPNNVSQTLGNRGKSGRSGIRVLNEGWCWKQGALMKNWKRRYFRLNAIKLSYYETSEHLTPIRSITTHDIKAVRILPRFCNRANCLEVETPNRKFYMHPEVDGDENIWKTELENVILSTGMYLPRTKSV